MVEIPLQQYSDWLIKITKIDAIKKLIDSNMDDDDKVIGCRALLRED